MFKHIFLLAALASPLQASTPLSFPVMDETGEVATWTSAETPKGVYIMEIFFNTCPACNANVDNVRAMVAAYKADTQVQVLEVSTDKDQDDYNEWIKKYGHITTLVKGDRMFLKAEGIKYVPTVLVKDCTLTTTYKYVGVWTEKAKEAIVKAVEDAKKLCPLETSGDK